MDKGIDRGMDRGMYKGMDRGMGISGSRHSMHMCVHSRTTQPPACVHIFCERVVCSERGLGYAGKRPKALSASCAIHWMRVSVGKVDMCLRYLNQIYYILTEYILYIAVYEYTCQEARWLDGCTIDETWAEVLCMGPRLY